MSVRGFFHGSISGGVIRIGLFLIAGTIGEAGLAQDLPKSGENQSARRDPAELVVEEETTPGVEEARGFCRELMKRLGLPGLSASVAVGGELVFSEGFGLADLENPTEVSRVSRFRIGSLSKLVTIGAVGRLVDEGKLDLDAPVQDYVPYFPEKKWKLTTRQLCSHTAGIRHYGPNDGLESNKRFETVQEGVGIFADDPLKFEPGTSYSYSSYGYNLVSAVIEGASGMTFLDYLDKAVLKPLSMTSTTADDNRLIIENRAGFYHVNPDGSVVNSPYVDSSYKWAGGGMLSTSEDLVRLGLAHLKPGFLAKKTLDEVFSPQEAAATGDFKVGLGWRLARDEEGRTMIHHGGAIAGGRAYILAYPEHGVVAVLLTNTFTRFGRAEAQDLVRGFMVAD